MLVKVAISNFLSFKDTVEIDFSANKKIKSHSDYVMRASDDNYSDVTIDVLPVYAMFGWNATWKTNLYKAFKFLQNFLLSGPLDGWVGDNAPRRGHRFFSRIFDFQPFFLNEESVDKDTIFDITFTSSGKVYNYYLALNKWEWLVKKEKLIDISSASKVIFERTEDNVKPKIFKDQLMASNITNFKNNLPILSVCMRLSYRNDFFAFAWEVEQFLMKIQLVSFIDWTEIFDRNILELLEDSEYRDVCIKIMKLADINIEWMRVERKKIKNTDVTFESNSKGKSTNRHFGREDKGTDTEIQLWHAFFNKENEFIGNMGFNLRWESEWTRKLLSFLGVLIPALLKGDILIVDEIDRSLHPELVQMLIRMMQNPKINKKKSQIIFNAHNYSLLDSSIFRKDQVFIFEKNYYWATNIFSLRNEAIRDWHNRSKLYFESILWGKPTMWEIPDNILDGFEKENDK